ncbi:MAG: glycosyltransferase [Thermoplasmata archaeon]|nr:glycosyltransferase [Thermoplasmata archaeon]
MEIAFFTESYLPTRDGVAHEVSALAGALTRLGHRVRVYAPNPVIGAPPRREVVDGVPVLRMRSLPVPLYQEYRWTLWPFPALRGERIAEEVDVVHLHTPGILGSAAFISARRWHKPLVGTFHTNVWEMRHSFPPTLPVRLFFRAAWWYTLGTYSRCDAVTAPTAPARDALLKGARKPFARAVEVVPNGIEVDRFRPGVTTPDWRARCGLPEGPLLTYLGRLTQDKGVHRFLDAVANLSGRNDVSAIVGGVGPEEPSVRRRLADDPRLAGRVRYVGPVAEEVKAALLSQTDLFVLPSTADTSSVALLEAMACGAACVASDVGGPSEVVKDGRTGRLVPVLAEGALAKAVSELLDDSAERRRLASAARAWVVGSASIEQTARRFISLYELLLTEKRHGAAGDAP